MKHILLISALSLGFSSAAWAAIDPNAPNTSIPSVVQKCELVANDASGDSTFSGICINSTQAYLDGLKAAPVDPATLDQNITDLVLQLVPLAQTDVACNAVDDEVARAIKLASAYASTPEQLALLVQISESVAACDGAATAALPPAGTPSPTI